MPPPTPRKPSPKISLLPCMGLSGFPSSQANPYKSCTPDCTNNKSVTASNPTITLLRERHPGTSRGHGRSLPTASQSLPNSSPHTCFTSLLPSPLGLALTDHFPLGAEEGMAFQALVVRALGDVCEHLVMHLVCCAVGDPEKHREVSPGLHCTSSHLDVPPLSVRESAAWFPPGHASAHLALAS